MNFYSKRIWLILILPLIAVQAIAQIKEIECQSKGSPEGLQSLAAKMKEYCDRAGPQSKDIACKVAEREARQFEACNALPTPLQIDKFTLSIDSRLLNAAKVNGEFSYKECGQELSTPVSKVEIDITPSLLIFYWKGADSRVSVNRQTLQASTSAKADRVWSCSVNELKNAKPKI